MQRVESVQQLGGGDRTGAAGGARPRRRRHTLSGFVFGGFFLSVLAGCGYQTYEERIEHSKKYFAYLERNELNLAPSWKDGPVEELRVPIQFKPIRKPAPIKNEQGQLEEPPVDPRQPNYLSLELPGLLGAWEAPFDLVINGQKQTRKGYIYAVSNSSMFLSEDAARAPDFTRILLDKITEKLALPAIDPLKDRTSEEYPKTRVGAFGPQRKFDAYRLKSSDQLVVDQVPYTIDIYAHSNKKIQVDLLVVTPVGIDSQAKLPDRVAWMLELLSVSDKLPQRPASRKTGAGPAGPAPAPATGF